MTGPGRYPQELRERAVRMVLEHQDEHPSQWAAICSIAAKFGISHETLRNWVLGGPRSMTGCGPG
jgi:transposase